MNKVENFFLAPASPRPLGVLRIGVAAVLLTQAYLLRTSVLDFFAHDGIIQGELAQYLSTPHTPRISWLVQMLSPLGISEATCIFSVCGLYLVSLFLMGIGLWTRPTSRSDLVSTLGAHKYGIYLSLWGRSLCACFSFLPDVGSLWGLFVRGCAHPAWGSSGQLCSPFGP